MTRLLFVSSPEKPSGYLSEAHAFCAYPDGLPYRAQPVYESNAAMGKA
jgi:hypothetical protein